jgi:hypothetical protein
MPARCKIKRFASNHKTTTYLYWTMSSKTGSTGQTLINQAINMGILN